MLKKYSKQITHHGSSFTSRDHYINHLKAIRLPCTLLLGWCGVVLVALNLHVHEYIAHHVTMTNQQQQVAVKKLYLIGDTVNANNKEDQILREIIMVNSSESSAHVAVTAAAEKLLRYPAASSTPVAEVEKSVVTISKIKQLSHFQQRKKRVHHQLARTSRTKIVYLLHLHKSGGTLMCNLARRNHLSADRRNCNAQADQRCCGGADDYVSQAAFARKTSLGFVANERHMYTAMDMEDYVYTVVLRVSVDRYVSHYRNAHESLSRKQKPFQPSFSKWTRNQPDNWNVRHICGTRCMDTAKYNLTLEDYEYTLARLRLFHSVIFVEDFQDSFDRFAAKVGWKLYKYYDLPDRTIKESVPDKDDIDARMTVLDDALYRDARNIFDNGDIDSKSGYQKAFDLYALNRTTTSSCKNPCCGKCSRY